MKPRRVIRDYTTLAVGSAVIGGVGGAAGLPAAGVVSNAMAGMNIMSTGLTAKVGMDVMGDMKKLNRKKGLL